MLMLRAGFAWTAPVTALPYGQLTVSDVQTIIAQAVTQAKHDNQAVVVAVTDREGNILGVFDMTGAPTASGDDALGIFSLVTPATTQEIAIQKARTAAFLSSDQNAFSTRTALQITGKHFPVGVQNAGPGPLFGLPMSSLPCGDVQKNGSGLTGALGGIPLYKNGAIAGGIGVDGARNKQGIENQSNDEVIALAGTRSIYHVPPSITANNILVNGFRFNWIGSRLPNALPVIPYASLPGTEDTAAEVPNHMMMAGAAQLPQVVEAGVPGEWRYPAIDSTVSNLTAADVVKLVDQSLEQEKTTRAAIRVPVGIPARMQVGVTDTAGTVLGLFRTDDATMFSMDIVIQKGRTVTAFSNPNDPSGLATKLRQDIGLPMDAPLAVTSRTIEFLAQQYYPPGITGTIPGPLFCYDFMTPPPQPPFDAMKKAAVTLPYCLQQQLYFTPPTPNCQPYGDGITLFPGSTPLYKDGVLVGGLGISGDGVDQDDYVTNTGAQGYLPPNAIRATSVQFRGTYLPFFKFPRHPGLD